MYNILNPSVYIPNGFNVLYRETRILNLIRLIILRQLLVFTKYKILIDL